MTAYPWTAWLWWISGAALGLLSLWLLYWSLLKDRSKGRRRCPKCWYNMSGTDSMTCSECGQTVKREKKLYKTRRHKRWALVSIGLLIAGHVTHTAPRIQRVGWLGAVPTTVLIMFAGSIDDFKSQAAFRVVNRLISIRMWRWQRSWLATKATRMLDESPSAGKRAWAGHLLAVFGYDNSELTVAIPSLIAALSDENADVRANAAMALSIIPTEGNLAVPALIERLDDERGVRMWAAFALGHHGREARHALPLLIKMLEDPDEQIRIVVAEAVCAIADDPAPAFPVLRSFLAHQSWGMRWRAANALLEAGPEAAPLVKDLVVILKDPSQFVRVAAATALGGIGPEAEPARAELSLLLNDPVADVRDAAEQALDKIGEKS